MSCPVAFNTNWSYLIKGPTWFLKTSNSINPRMAAYVPYIFAKPIQCPSDDGQSGSTSNPTSFQLITFYITGDSNNQQYSVSNNIQVWQANQNQMAYNGESDTSRYVINVDPLQGAMLIIDRKDAPDAGTISYAVVNRSTVPSTLYFAESISPPVTAGDILSTGNFFTEYLHSYYTWGAVAVCAVCLIIWIVKKR